MIELIGPLLSGVFGIGGVIVGQRISLRATAAEHDRQLLLARDREMRERVVRLLQQLSKYEAAVGGVHWATVVNNTREHPKKISAEDVKETTRISNQNLQLVLETALEVRALGPSWAVAFARDLPVKIERLIRVVETAHQHPTAPNLEASDRAVGALRQHIEDGIQEFSLHLGAQADPLL